MRLIDLDFTHFLRGPVTEDDDAYKEFLKSVNYVLDLDKPEHRKSLLKWLNKWGCRQFAIK
ncbi:MAG: hypothetical protein U9Q76_09305, partial [candidate division WOR-3 bacterium]|nr:hypothetical protein [candidate division WOR-3 bacterium]